MRTASSRGTRILRDILRMRQAHHHRMRPFPIAHQRLIFICEAHARRALTIWKATRSRMNLAVLPQSDRRADGTQSTSILAGTRVLDDLAAAEPLWRRLEQAGASATPYQRFEWLAHW